MTEIEKFKSICDKIWISLNEWWRYEDINKFRNIIFTQEFIDKYRKEYTKEHLTIEDSIYRSKDFYELFNNLDNIVDYLYNLIEWK